MGIVGPRSLVSGGVTSQHGGHSYRRRVATQPGSGKATGLWETYADPEGSFVRAFGSDGAPVERGKVWVVWVQIT